MDTLLKRNPKKNSLMEKIKLVKKAILIFFSIDPDASDYDFYLILTF
jgi:hypothetical protein